MRAGGGDDPEVGLGLARWSREAEADLGEEAVLLAGVAGPARGHHVVPGVGAAAGPGHDVVDVLGRPVAVLAAVAVAGEDGPARERAPGCGTAPGRSGGAGSPTGTGSSARSECSTAPLRATISAFSFSTSTTARRIGTTQSGSKLALSSRALPKRRDLLIGLVANGEVYRGVSPVRVRVPAVVAPLEVGDQVVGVGAAGGAVLGLEAEPQVVGVGQRAGTAGAATSAGGRAAAPGAARSSHSDGRAQHEHGLPAPRTTRRATRSGGSCRHAVRTVPGRPCDPCRRQRARGPLVPSGRPLWRCSWFSPPPRRAATRRSAACSPPCSTTSSA